MLNASIFSGKKFMHFTNLQLLSISIDPDSKAIFYMKNSKTIHNALP